MKPLPERRLEPPEEKVSLKACELCGNEHSEHEWEETYYKHFCDQPWCEHCRSFMCSVEDCTNMLTAERTEFSEICIECEAAGR